MEVEVERLGEALSPAEGVGLELAASKDGEEGDEVSAWGF